jgi:hypothetical protein
MVVLPEEVYKSMMNRGSILQDPVDLSALDTHENMSKLLHAHGIPAGEQFTAYDQQLKRLLMLLRQKREAGRDTSLIERAIISALTKGGGGPPAETETAEGGEDEDGAPPPPPPPPPPPSPTFDEHEGLSPQGHAPFVPQHQPPPPPPRSSSLSAPAPPPRKSTLGKVAPGTRVLVKTREGNALHANGEKSEHLYEDIPMDVVSGGVGPRSRRPRIKDDSAMETGTHRPSVKRSASWDDDLAHRAKGRTLEIEDDGNQGGATIKRRPVTRPRQRILKEKMERTRLPPLKLENSIIRAAPRVVSKRITSHDGVDEPYTKKAMIEVKQEPPTWRPSHPVVRPSQRIARERAAHPDFIGRYVKEEPPSPPASSPQSKRAPEKANRRLRQVLQKTIKKEVKQEGGRLHRQITPFKVTLW